MPTIVVAILALAAVPATSVVMSALDSKTPASPDDELVTVQGTVTGFVHEDHEDEQNDADDYADDMDDEHEREYNESRACAFVIDNSTVVEVGPWWYWLSQGFNFTDFVHVGDVVNVTGVWEDSEDGNMTALEAWHIDNLTTGNELTIKEEGRPPWAGGPKAHGIDPWPPSKMDD